MAVQRMKALATLAALASHSALGSVRDLRGFGSAQHVVLFGLDGLDVRCLHQALANGSAPYLEYMRNHGVYTDKARNNKPAVSLPNWASIFYGAGVMFHGVTSNGWTYCTREEDDVNYTPPYLDDCVVYPDLFTVTKQQQPDFVTALFYEWTNFDAILPNETVPIDTRRFIDSSDCEGTTNASQLLTDEALTLITPTSMPQLLVLHYDEADTCATESSCFDDGGQFAITAVDTNIGRVLNAVKAAGLSNSTVFVVVSDHGRNEDGTHHGGKAKSNFETQWVVYGQDIIEGSRELKSAISIEDTAPTIAHLLGFVTPTEWHGRVVHEVLLQANESLYSAAKSAWGACLNAECARKTGHPEVQKAIEVNWTMGIVSTCVVVGGLCLATFVRFYSYRRGYEQL
ncbi:hypothetical protein H310_07617 [Aphanomyces invadans]|uniref:Sulfatase N-terminal domain-containing protein n=1 Tax=Aphanomyces invadans TaxID=157072 RepID=A0A024U1B9_9STRA|nr:hypothetical protein H310_07617 [Aphanomyces invadans]ETW00226.1 hypothetical protein H310_07617 [Aphanomyces invadans]|eukprot:XP_008871251.1 hypothetical protein H310_07617 [Aphanomyces invadans]